MKRIIGICFIFFLGCSPFELSRLLGAGTKVFRTQGKIYSKIFNEDFFSCYEQITQKLNSMGATSYRGSQKQSFLIVNQFNNVFAQCDGATEVAIFFTEIGKFKTKVEVSSLNYSLAEFVASKLFNNLEKKIEEEIGFERELD